MNHPGFMVDARKFSKTPFDLNGKLHFRIQQTVDDNVTWVGYFEDPRRTSEDDIGALYYVVAVIFIYGLSIVMMIASHIRKNKQDNQLRTYLKEMAKLRKNDRREKVLCKISDIANRRQQQESSQKLHEKLKDVTVDNGADSDAFQPLMAKDTNDDTTDSVFLQPDCCISPDSQSSSLSDCQCNIHSGRVRSLSFHESGRRKSNGSHPASVLDSKTIRLQERPSLNVSNQRSVISTAESPSPSLSDFRLSPACGRERSASVHDAQPYRITRPKATCTNDIKFHKISETKQNAKIAEIKPTCFHEVEEDAIL